jgi:poly-gamma-glutamate capsule biosynthesis protein CapA/YwtB (metallophosphatase superfamily)
VSRTTTVAAVGDVILDEPDPDHFFAPATAVIQAADVAIAHVEVPHTDRGIGFSTDVPAPAAPPAHLAALKGAGFDVATLAGNHMFDQGAPGVIDTVETLHGLGIATAGAGVDLDAARTPAVVERNGVAVGVLSYNCVGPKDSWASGSKPGCAYVEVLTHYELDHASPGGPPSIYTFATPKSLDAMADDIRSLRREVDVVVVAFHKGIGHTPAVVAMYEPAVARVAVDSGAHMVVGHHAHIMRGIEVHHGASIFHGLGNFVTVTRALSIEDNPSPERLAWARRREQLFGFSPDPDMPYYPFHPESRNTAIAVCEVGPTGVEWSGFVPCRIDGEARPVPVAWDEGGAEVAAYIDEISERAGLRMHLERDGDRVRVEPLH